MKKYIKRIVKYLAPVLLASSFSVSLYAQEQVDLEDPIGDEKAVEALKKAGSQGTGIKIKPSSVGLKLSSSKIVNEVKDISGVQDVIFDSTGFGFKISLSGDFFFAYDKYDLLPEAVKSLEQIYGLVEEYEAKNLMLIGHTDAHGSDEYNQTLSENRANSVKQWFIGKGVSENIITTEGRGEREPVEPNTKADGSDNPEGRAKNRRVDLEVTTNKKVNHVPVQ